MAQFQELTQRSEYAAALRHYAGPLLDGTEFFDAPELDNWLQAQRQHLHGRWTSAIAAQAQALEERGDLAEALGLWQHLLRGDELRESWHAEAIRLHLRLGEREAALRQFARCEEVLQKELGLSPLPETRHLAEQARSAVVAAPAPLAALRPSPPPPTMLVGREAALAVSGRPAAAGLAERRTGHRQKRSGPGRVRATPSS